ncbi:6-N-hydroxylaminopurine resistance protein [compost metagenome]
MTATPFTLDAVLTGKAVAYTRPGSCSAIDKQLRTGELTVNELGLGGDEQGDLRVHGGKDKAIHHYPREHYALWAGELGAQTLLQAPGAFGENFSTYGCTEQTVCLGDRFRVGTALLEISQGRMPCWKLNDLGSRTCRYEFNRRGVQAGITECWRRVCWPRGHHLS